MRVAVDLTWVRPGKVGGTESCVRNLLDGISEVNPSDLSFVLLLSRDNAESFSKYETTDCFELEIADVYSSNQLKRVIWQNLKMGKVMKKLNIDICLEPVYGKPFITPRNIKYYTTIHDLQAIHYPQYFSKSRVSWMKAGWKNAINTSFKVIAISQYVKQDILNHFSIDEKKVLVIYDALKIDSKECAKDEELQKYNVMSGEYYYTVSSLLPHKNLKTIILALAKLKKEQSTAFRPLIISGVGGHSKNELEEIINNNNLKEDIIFTPFIDNAERNLLYKNCKTFLFPSVFEGFGMPPIEAMIYGIPVITTNSTSIPEVTDGVLNYVSDPLNPTEWAMALESSLKVPDIDDVERITNRYKPATIAKEYINMFRG